MIAEVRCRWIKHTRYYEVLLHQDLWGGWIVTRVWGRRDSPLGRVRHHPCRSYAEGLERVRQMQDRRARRGYAAVGERASGRDSVLDSHHGSYRLGGGVR